GKLVIEPVAPAPGAAPAAASAAAAAPAPAAPVAEAPALPVVVTTPSAVVPPSAPTAVPAAPVAPLASVAPATAPTTAVALPANVMAMVNFAKEQVELTTAEQQQFATTIEMMKKDENRRINIISYATSADAQNSTARRISLKRALAVRKYLIGQGIDTVRINVQAMGNAAAAGTQADRVDVLLVANG
ncbi:MAG: lysophospholipase, partial [Proteobacteria bacterium]|nr:lysophospholipase [Pseudomonadota bacterium]